MEEYLLLDGYPALIEVTLTYKGTVTYHENLPFKKEPTDKDVLDFVKYIRPLTKQNFILYNYLRPLNPNEK